MTEALTSQTVPLTHLSSSSLEWSTSDDDIVVGKDILELLSSSMYVDPMTIYREYTQNAADAIDEARREGSLPRTTAGQVDISINTASRAIRIRDNGNGVPAADFVKRLRSLGASKKRGGNARGFRGVGRLAGLGYCQELIFRSRTSGEKLVSEMRWDCRLLKSALRSADNRQRLAEIVQSIVSTRRVTPADQPEHFFEVELKGVVRHRDDRLLNSVAVSEYLSQVAPVPFSPEFRHAAEITSALQEHVDLGNLEIRVNESEAPIYRPHRDVFHLNEVATDRITQLEIKTLTDIDGNLAAIAWVAHHGYYGALPMKALVKGLRLRSGNVQVGDHALLESMFTETRFNGWAIGEVHVIDKKVLPNGRRDHFEQSAHFDNLLNQLTPLVRDITARCRDSSIARKWLRDFELQKDGILQDIKVLRRGGLTKKARQGHADSIAKATSAIDKILVNRYLDEATRVNLKTQAAQIRDRIQKALGQSASEIDPLDQFPPKERKAYQHIISLIYDCSTNRSAALSLVDKLLARLADRPVASAKRSGERATKKKATVSKPKRRTQRSR